MEAAIILSGFDPKSTNEKTIFNICWDIEKSDDKDAIKISRIYSELEKDINRVWSMEGAEIPLTIKEWYLTAYHEEYCRKLYPRLVMRRLHPARDEIDIDTGEAKKIPSYETYYLPCVLPRSAIFWAESKGFDVSHLRNTAKPVDEMVVGKTYKELISEFFKKSSRDPDAQNLKKIFFHAGIALGVLIERERLAGDGREKRFAADEIEKFFDKNTTQFSTDLGTEEVKLVYASMPGGYRYPTEGANASYSEPIIPTDLNPVEVKPRKK